MVVAFTPFLNFYHSNTLYNTDSDEENVLLSLFVNKVSKAKKMVNKVLVLHIFITNFAHKIIILEH